VVGCCAYDCCLHNVGFDGSWADEDEPLGSNEGEIVHSRALMIVKSSFNMLRLMTVLE